ncbi:hypothetical protein Mapa_010304 [Marchantia paleacea]|nr:hypothetical protein Mapa_010304 [Marchantia paleacea]
MVTFFFPSRFINFCRSEAEIWPSRSASATLNATLSSAARPSTSSNPRPNLLFRMTNSPKSICPSPFTSTSSTMRRSSSFVTFSPRLAHMARNSCCEIFPSPFLSMILNASISC